MNQNYKDFWEEEVSGCAANRIFVKRAMSARIWMALLKAFWIPLQKERCCVVDEEGKRVFESKATTGPQAIYDELTKSGVSLAKVGLEAGSLSKFFTKGLQDLDLNAICP